MWLERAGSGGGEILLCSSVFGGGGGVKCVGCGCLCVCACVCVCVCVCVWLAVGVYGWISPPPDSACSGRAVGLGREMIKS